jgi:hypothetical protein
MRKPRWYAVLLIVASILAACGAAPAAQTIPTVEAVVEAPTAAPTEIVEPTDAPAVEETPEVAEPTVEEAPEVAEPTSAPAADDTATALSEAEVIAALQETVDLWNQAYEDADHDTLAKAIDPRSPTLRRILGDQLDHFTQSQGSGNLHGKVIHYEQRDHGLILAHIDVYGSINTFTFRNVDGSWLLSEPRRAELGKKKVIETEHVRLEYYGWDTDVAPEIAEMLEEAHRVVVDQMGRGPEQKVRAQLRATAQLARGRGTILAFYMFGTTRNRRGNNITVSSPNSYQGGQYDRATGWHEQMRTVLEHEYVHLVHDCCFTNLFFQAEWMSEGLAVYLTDGGHTNWFMPYVQQAIQDDEVLPIWAPSPAPAQLPKHLDSWGELNEAERSEAYGLSATLVDYIVTHHGGMDGFWKLAIEYSEVHDIRKAVPNALGISLEELEHSWIDDLKQRYG